MVFVRASEALFAQTALRAPELAAVRPLWRRSVAWAVTIAARRDALFLPNVLAGHWETLQVQTRFRTVSAPRHRPGEQALRARQIQLFSGSLAVKAPRAAQQN